MPRDVSMECSSLACGVRTLTRSGVTDKLGNCALGDQPALLDDHDGVRRHGQLGQQVTGDQDSAAAIDSGAQEFPQPVHAGRVEAVGRLVENENAGITEQGTGQHEPLTHAEREPADPATSVLGEVDLLEHFVDPAGGIRFGWARIRRWFRAVRPGWKPVASSAAPTVKAGRSSCPYGVPSTSAAPAVGCTKPRIIRKVVVFPAPLGPINPVMVPGLTSKLRSFTAVTLPKRFVSPRTGGGHVLSLRRSGSACY